jgi:hypothetical protein
MTVIEHAAEAYKQYRSKCGLAWQEDELDAEKFMVSVVEQIQLAVDAVPSQTVPHVDKSDLLSKDTENGQQDGQTGLQVGFNKNEVVLQFDTMIRHMTLNPKAARALSEMLRQCSYQAEGKRSK